MGKTNKRSLFLIGVFTLAMLLCAMIGVDRTVPVAYAIDWDTANGVVSITTDTTITDDVNVYENTTLNITVGKTLTISGTLNIDNDAKLTINGPGTLEILESDTGSSGALNILSGSIVINDGRVIVTATGSSDYSFFADTSTEVKINDGALMISGGTSAGMKAGSIIVNKGLLRVEAPGTNDVETYGIMMESLIVGSENNYQYHPTIEVVADSTNSVGIANYDYLSSGELYYYGGSMEITSKTRAIKCSSTTWVTPITYSGPTKAEITGSSIENPYLFVTHDPVNSRSKIQVGGYGILVKYGRKQDMVVVNSVNDVATFAGRTSVGDTITAFDQIIKDMFCTTQYGQYGMVKDLNITGGDSTKMSATSTGITINGAFLGPVTISGTYTYFDVTNYAEMPFEITLTVATEITSSLTKWGGKMICPNDVTISSSVSVSGCADLYILAGKTLTLSNGLRVQNNKTFRIYGPGKLEIIKDGSTSSDTALKLSNGSNLILNDGYVDVLSTGKCSYCVLGEGGTTITINDGALIVDGGKSAGIKAHNIDLNRGLLRVNATGTDGTKTYGILMDSLTVGDDNEFSYRPTLEVVANSTNSIGIANPNPFYDGMFLYRCGFMEVTSSTTAFECHSTGWYDSTRYKGENKETAATNGSSDSPYYFVTHADWALVSNEDYDYCILFNDGRKQDGIYITPTSKTFSFEGRESVSDALTEFDQFIKDFFYPILDGPYGIVKDISIVDESGQVIATDTGFSVKGKYNGTSTIRGKYTYFDGTAYQEKSFELGLNISAGPELTYEANEKTITATYGTLGTYDLTLVGPSANLTYDNTAKIATITAGYDEDFFPNAQIKYFKNGVEVASCVNAGDYVAKVIYGTATVEAPFTIAKANPTYTAPTGLTALPGNTLADIVLPTGWSWVDSTNGVGEIGNNIFKANFTPADTNNYNTVENVDVVVAVSAPAPENPASQHWLCLGWIALLLAILELIAYFSMRLYKKKVLRIIALVVSFAIFVFALTTIFMHNCSVGIVALALSSVLFVLFALFSVMFRKKQTVVKVVPPNVEQDAVVFNKKKTLKEEYANLSKENKKFYDQIKAHAIALEGVKESESQNYYTVSYKTNKIVRLKIKKGEVVAEFFTTDKTLKELAGSGVKESASSIKIKTDEDAQKAIKAIDYKFKSLTENKE